MRKSLSLMLSAALFLGAASATAAPLARKASTKGKTGLSVTQQIAQKGDARQLAWPKTKKVGVNCVSTSGIRKYLGGHNYVVARQKTQPKRPPAP